MTPERLLLLNQQIAEHGIAAHEAEVARHLADLRATGFDSTCLDIVADRTQPTVARERAFGRLPLFHRHTAIARRDAAVQHCAA